MQYFIFAFCVFFVAVFMSLLSSPIAADQVSAAVNTMNSELVFLLECGKVPHDIIANSAPWVTQSSRQSHAKEVRGVIMSGITLDPASGPQH